MLITGHKDPSKIKAYLQNRIGGSTISSLVTHFWGLGGTARGQEGFTPTKCNCFWSGRLIE